jgi:TolB-like protein
VTMNENDKRRVKAQHGKIWFALIAYLVSGWAVVEILFVVRERFSLPQSLESLVLGLFLAGFVACALLLRMRRSHQHAPLMTVATIISIALVTAALAMIIANWLQPVDSESDISSVAVLPCKYDGSEDYAFLGPGVAEEVHGRLARIKSIQIPAWRSVVRSLELASDQVQIADMLQVDHLTKCRVERGDDGFTLTAEILVPATDETLWSGRYQYAATDLVHALAEISLALADALIVRLEAEESDRLTQLPTTSPEAYKHYLRARQAQGTRQWTLGFASWLSIEEADYEALMKHYRAAIELDPDFADAWAGMATATQNYAFASPDDSFDEALSDGWEKSKSYAKKALELDDC